MDLICTARAFSRVDYGYARYKDGGNPLDETIGNPEHITSTHTMKSTNYNRHIATSHQALEAIRTLKMLTVYTLRT
jgi:hypothetical protein